MNNNDRVFAVAFGVSVRVDERGARLLLGNNRPDFIFGHVSDLKGIELVARRRCARPRPTAPGK